VVNVKVLDLFSGLEGWSQAFKDRGHEVVVVPKIAGGMNGVIVDPVTGLMHGGACWRADGSPMGVSGGPAHPRAMRARKVE